MGKTTCSLQILNSAKDLTSLRISLFIGNVLWVIIWFPALQLFEAEEALGRVRAVLGRGMDEARFCHLEKV